MEERCIVVDADDKNLGDGSKKTCTVFVPFSNSSDADWFILQATS